MIINIKILFQISRGLPATEMTLMRTKRIKKSTAMIILKDSLDSRKLKLPVRPLVITKSLKVYILTKRIITNVEMEVQTKSNNSNSLLKKKKKSRFYGTLFHNLKTECPMAPSNKEAKPLAILPWETRVQ